MMHLVSYDQRVKFTGLRCYDKVFVIRSGEDFQEDATLRCCLCCKIIKVQGRLVDNLSDKWRLLNWTGQLPGGTKCVGGVRKEKKADRRMLYDVVRRIFVR